MLFHDTLNRVRSDAEEYQKSKPNWSGIPPATKTRALNHLITPPTGYSVVSEL